MLNHENVRAIQGGRLPIPHLRRSCYNQTCPEWPERRDVRGSPSATLSRAPPGMGTFPRGRETVPPARQCCRVATRGAPSEE
jgi:hypothetical protein